MLIRPAKPEDTAAVVDVIRAVYDEYRFTWDEADYHADLYDLDSYYLRAGNPFWIAEVDDSKPVGTVALQIFEPINGIPGRLSEVDGMVRISGCDCALTRLYVKPEARGAGVGSALFREAIDAAVKGGCSHMEIWSDKRFHEAHKLYQKLGAEVVGDRICDDPDESPEWGLILRLDRNL